MKTLSVLLMSLLLTGYDDAAQGSEDHALAVVYRQVEAFNRHDVDGIMEVIHPEFKWFSVNGDAVEVETESAEELATAMQDYFKALPSVRSQITQSVVTGPYVAITELATWDLGPEAKQQTSLGVYEVRGGQIVRVWYFPASQ